ncbi:TPA: ATP-grasp domain-containing protein [Klebsiella pneumoniae]|uniref:ATP-grasp domain-containing protein n=1 Tax=Klebsiella pneumoniae TaxID=573 RepID=UPI0009BC3D6C|nr:ATP-grasp domain-containing protein [Klebsiella pneumoniae]HEP0822141.1 ATP-grasp domain-containing protein [Klebsiella pneumoniae subsp. pneumoniae]EJO2888005.1 ATP-grasp domain-containing protein [Klebsiella pneumoniae]KAB7532585.1 ATP-grasp domain-containing protein [Klebsiella pneumoniae]MBC4781717.1 ATP-grasp domain-containing protein [Klebsiella pneumoniae]MBS2951653.1 ATP-grasp domain-containing protein [Klebsiella pneumoniae]
MKHIVVINSSEFSGVELLDKLLKEKYKVSYFRNLAYIRDWDSSRTDDVLRRLHNVIDLPNTHTPEIVRDAVGILNDSQPVDALICIDDFSLEAAACAAEHINVPFSSVNAVKTTKNKLLSRQILEGTDKNAPWVIHERDYHKLPSVLASVELPVIVKPVTSASSRLAYIIKERAQINLLINNIEEEINELPSSYTDFFNRGFLVEKYLTGPLVSVEIGRMGNSYYPFMVTSRIRCASDNVIELGSVMPSSLNDKEEQECFKLAISALDKIGLDNGIFHIEMIYTNSGPAIVEVNGRLGGRTIPVLYELATGNSMFEHLINISQRAEPKAESVYQGQKAVSFFFKAEQYGKVLDGTSRALPQNLASYIQSFEFMKKPGDTLQKGEILGWTIVSARQEEIWNVLHELIQFVESSSGVEVKKPLI